MLMFGSVRRHRGQGQVPGTDRLKRCRNGWVQTFGMDDHQLTPVLEAERGSGHDAERRACADFGDPTDHLVLDTAVGQVGSGHLQRHAVVGGNEQVLVCQCGSIHTDIRDQHDADSSGYPVTCCNQTAGLAVFRPAHLNSLGS